MDKGQRKSTFLRNEMDVLKWHSLNKGDICSQKGNNRKTCETKQHILFYFLYLFEII